jgi:class 3 adenylate cyclase
VAWADDVVDVAQSSPLALTDAEPPAGERYLLLVDISGYTGFMASVERAHGVDFSAGIPAGYAILGALLGGVIEGVQPTFGVVKLEGDAVFAVAPASSLDGQGDAVLDQLRSVYQTFTERRTQARTATDHRCTACPTVASLDLKMVLHRGHAVRQTVGTGSDLLGPAVNVAHRLLKNSVRSRIGFRPYLFLTDSAAAGLRVSEQGLAHREEYAEVGSIGGRIIDLSDG